MADAKRKGLLPPSRQIRGRPVPGGKSQYGAGSADVASHLSVGNKRAVGKGRGIVGGGTADVLDRTPAQQKRGTRGGLVTGSAKVPGRFF